ncbi:hypothetical protein T03_5618 [Trichinella britovi]|uniref:Uncharacterized protein n=1 Tax=Trichinella britovi TaxID=45882 RepID=A0A0V1AIC5_TRIBR|nr:hypothetical protein T03_5618 [Trichinella britovi]
MARRKLPRHKWPGWALFHPLCQNRPLFHFVRQVFIHRAAFDVIIPLDHRCHLKDGPYGTTTALFIRSSFPPLPVA